MNRSKQIIGILLIVLSISGMIFWEKWGKNQFLYEDVLVLRENVDKGTTITASMLTTKKLNITEDYIPLQEKEWVIGKETTAFVHKGVPLFEPYFQEITLSPSEKRGMYILALPEEWILSKPETLSRGDRVFFFSEGRMLTDAFVAAINAEGLVEVVVSKLQAEELSDAAGKGGNFVLAYQ